MDVCISTRIHKIIYFTGYFKEQVKVEPMTIDNYNFLEETMLVQKAG